MEKCKIFEIYIHPAKHNESPSLQMIYQVLSSIFEFCFFSTIFGHILTCRMINMEIFANYKMSEELINDLAINLKNYKKHCEL